MTGQGHQIFVDELTRFADRTADQRVQAIAERIAEPLRVAVRGRRGAGCRTVARALDRAGIAAGIRVTPLTSAADVQVYVVAEVVKPEDSEALAATNSNQPVLAVLNKADLTGFAGDGPIAAAQTRCAHLSALVGVPMEPMIGLLAVAALDDLDEASWAALRALAAHPGSSASLDGSFGGFLAANLPVPAQVRLRLLDTLDLFGIALGIAAFRQGSTEAQARALVRRVSAVDAVVGKVAAAGAEVRYRRVLEAVAELEALAVADERIGEFLSHDDTVVARMAAALDVAQACELEDGPATHLQRAVRWQRYICGSVSDVHRACGADIARGSLRLWSRAGGSGESGESR
jgi:hypothetical protein